ncbi:alcohol dehydrogenase [Sphingomonas hengshuiensis]|uniref:Alcohol dehydrogenase n=2 Tax=Sphingomonas hengshuiensis TaxID=1609977 RepID=A0A7U5BFM4_9SPHN|nr:PQQ-dependent dehydrogenase, methanol/ethanol family [Sphingomonas hengshuiensis]AJP74355.1 alcohol dehydrogenase [Sphingomonas hengshuiensis]
MTRRGRTVAVAMAGIAAVTTMAAVATRPAARAQGVVDAARITAGAPGEWLSTGRTYDEQRFSPLSQLTPATIATLGLAWSADLDTARGQEATPLMIDGALYVSTAWSMVKAYDARTGQPLWSYDPEVPRETLIKACCDAVNRGVAAWGDRLFVGTLDGRLVALDRHSGKPVWSVVTLDQTGNATITGAPRIVNGLVIIGNGGAEFGARGYVTAYDAATGKQAWRFYTVPARPGSEREPEYLKAAAATWFGDYWKQGGGGTVWDAMAYDPALDLLYIGVGNGSPWNQAYRSEGRGDNLYLSSIVAIHAKTGAYAWHYQTTPGDSWDFTATQHIMLADVTIDGRPRKVLMQAPKNGFFYVLDRTNGKLISARNYVPVNWATGIDMQTGRPIETPEARYYKTGKPFIGSPGATGAHSWQPMAFDPNTGLVFIPANLAAFPYIPDPAWKPAKLGFNVGIDLGKAAMPAIPAVRDAAAAATTGALIAWDPIAQQERWRVSYQGPWNGGLLATGGGLVFQGSAAGEFAAFAAADGRKLWSFAAQTGIVAAPISYELDGQQYIAVLAGWGGVWALAPGTLIDKSGPARNISRLLVFKAGGTATLPPPPPLDKAPLDPPPSTATPQVIAAGGDRFARFCGVCHGDAAVGGTLVPDLRRSGVINDAAAWQAIVHGGALKDNGMVGFASVMTASEIETVRHYVIKRANEDKALEQRNTTAARPASRKS